MKYLSTFFCGKISTFKTLIFLAVITPLAAQAGSENKNLLCTTDTGRTVVEVNLDHSGHIVVMARNNETGRELRYRTADDLNEAHRAYQVSEIYYPVGFPLNSLFSVTISGQDVLSIFAHSGSGTITPISNRTGFNYSFVASISGVNPRQGGTVMQAVRSTCVYSYEED